MDTHKSGASDEKGTLKNGTTPFQRVLELPPGVKCNNICHIGKKCGNVLPKVYEEMIQSINLQWTCPPCEIFYASNITPDLRTSAICQEEMDMYQHLTSQINGKGLTVAHINCCGLLSKRNEIQLLLEQCNIDILGVTETHLNDKVNDQEVQMENFKMHRLDRKGKSGGGCLIYYKETLEAIPRTEYHVKGLEAVWLEVIMNSQRLIIGNTYRAPDDKEFCDRIKPVLERLWIRRNNILLMGEMNSDLLKRNGNEQIQHYGRKLKQLMNNFGLKNVITEPTRIAEASATLIDFILTSEASKIITSGTFDLALSDHKLVFAVVNLKRQKQQPKIAFVRNYKNLDIGKLKEEFDVAPWWICNTFEDVEKM